MHFQLSSRSQEGAEGTPAHPNYHPWPLAGPQALSVPLLSPRRCWPAFFQRLPPSHPDPKAGSAPLLQRLCPSPQASCHDPQAEVPRARRSVRPGQALSGSCPLGPHLLTGNPHPATPSLSLQLLCPLPGAPSPAPPSEPHSGHHRAQHGSPHAPSGTHCSRRSCSPAPPSTMKAQSRHCWSGLCRPGVPLQPGARGYPCEGTPLSPRYFAPLPASALWSPPSSLQHGSLKDSALCFSRVTPSRAALDAEVSQQLQCATWPCARDGLRDAHRNLLHLSSPSRGSCPPESSTPHPRSSWPWQITPCSSPCGSQKPRGGPVLPSGLPAVAGLAVTSPPQLLSPQIPLAPQSCPRQSPARSLCRRTCCSSSSQRRCHSLPTSCPTAELSASRQPSQLGPTLQ